MQVYPELIWLVAVLAIATASDPVAKTRLSAAFRENWSERLQFANLNAEQADVLQSVATNAIEEAVHRILDRTRALCDEIIASGLHGDIKAEERSLTGDGEPIVDKIRRILREGLPSKNVPPLDPLTYGHLPIPPINIPDILQVELQLDNGTFEGLSAFQEDIDTDGQLSLLPPSVSVIVVFDVLEPFIQFITAYSLDAHAQDLDVWGIGNLTFKLFSLRVNGAVTVRSTLVSTQVNPCRINVTGRSSKVELTGLLGGGLTSDLVGEIFTDLVNENMNTLFSAVAQLVETEMCEYFRAKTVSEWIALLRKINMMPLPPMT